MKHYHVSKEKRSLSDLRDISASDQQKKYHEFVNILRQNNVSSLENAFDKLVNIFLCKLVDETENQSDLRFYWDGGNNYFDLMDRLQKMYKAGVEKFLGEDITYINQDDIYRALKSLNRDKEGIQREVSSLFIKQKFFGNNDFSLIDVHNEKLFYQNTDILVKIVQSWQDVRLTNPNNHNQFLGDMFEGFLDHGIKQSAGQFFTPMPICRFIIMSLPLESFIQRSNSPIKAIDYACGVGHFLNELGLQLNSLVEKHKPQDDISIYHKSIYGIEKEYRLSKVAKVSAFMYGQQGINICYGDGLVKNHESFPGIEDESFDLLIANPPYSVRGFLKTLSDEDRKRFTLTKIYLEKFKASSELVNLQKSRWFKTLSKEEQTVETNRRYLSFVQDVERDKRYHFIMAFDQKNPVLIIRSPKENKAVKQFLGYEWSSAKGNEGIKIIKDAKGRHLTPLYDEINRNNGDKLNSLISENFNGTLSIPKSLSWCAFSVPLEDMIDFSQPTFDKKLSITKKEENKIIRGSKWSSVKLGEVTTIINGGTPSTSEPSFWNNGDIYWATLVDTKQKYLTDTKRKITKDGLKHTTLLPINTVMLSSRATIGEVCINKVPTATNQGFKNFICNPKRLNFEYLYQILVYLRPVLINLVPSGSKYKEINSKVIYNFEIPLPPLDVQKKIISECNMVDNEVISARNLIHEAEKEIEELVSEISSHSCKLNQIASINPSKSEIRHIKDDNLVSFIEMFSVSTGGLIISSELRTLGSLRKGGYTYFADNDILIAKITPCMENGKCALATGLENGIGMGSTEFHVIRPDQGRILPLFLFAFLNREKIRIEASKTMTGSSGHRRVPAKFYENILIPLPTIEKQKEIVSKINSIKKNIFDAKAVINNESVRKKVILQNHL